MRKVHLLATVAAASLLLATSAMAQGKKDEMPARAPAAQQNAPAEKVAPPMHAGQKKPETTGQAVKSDDKGKADLKTEDHHKTGMKADDTKKPGTSGQATKSSEPGKAEMKIESKDKTGATAKETVDTKSGAAQKSSTAVDNKASTSGQGAAASANLTTQQRTKITSIIKQQKVAPVKLNVSVRVGTRVPDSVHFYPLPQQVFVIYPEWRGYDYILVGDEILVINPRTHEIVAILDA